MILHHNVGYASRSLYQNLIRIFDQKGFHQIVYAPVRNSTAIKTCDLTTYRHTTFYYPNVLRWYHRLLYPLKLLALYNDLKSKVDLHLIKFVYAYFVFSDGGIAYLLKKKHNIPYAVLVQSTDLNVFFKHLLYLRSFGRKILSSANHIFFISPPYQKALLQRYATQRDRLMIISKSKIVPFGIDPFWLRNAIKSGKKRTGKKIQLLYVGEFSRNKNVSILFQIVKNLNAIGYGTSLTLVGGGGDNQKAIIRQIGQNMHVRYLGHITDKTKLAQIYREADIFIMLSKYESFGLVYAEALSQGTPILYTRGQGFDEQFNDGEVGFAVDPTQSEDIIDKIIMIMNHYHQFSARCSLNVQKFDWEKNAKKYISILPQSM